MNPIKQKTSSIRRACIAGLVSFTFTMSGSVQATENWPTKPVTLIVPVSTGGVVDLVPRVLMPIVSQELGQSLVVDNKPGANLAIGAAQVARSKPDGYTLLAGSIPLTTNPLLNSVSYDMAADFKPVSMLGTAAVIAVVPRTLGVKTLGEFIELAKKSPGALNYASSAYAGLAHLNTAVFEKAAGIEMQAVLYKGQSPAVSDLVQNRVNIMLASPSTVKGFIDSGDLIPLAIVNDGRSPLFPEVPTFAELGFPAVDIDSWIGILAPSATQPEVIEKINKAFSKALSDPAVVAKLEELGVTAAKPGGPEILGNRIEAEIKRWPKVFDSIGIKKEN